MFRHSLTGYPKVTQSTGPRVVATLKYVKRHALDKRFGEEYGVMKSHCVQGLIWVWNDFLSISDDLSIYWDGHRALCDDFISFADMDMVVAAGVANRSTVHAEITSVVNSGALGVALLGGAQKELARTEVTNYIDAEIVVLKNTVALTVVLCNAAENKCRAHARTRGCDDMEGHLISYSFGTHAVKNV
jgi:hypothetical protein